MEQKRQRLRPLPGLAATIFLGNCAAASPVQPLVPHLPGTTVQQALAYPAFLINAPQAQRYRQQGLQYRSTGQLDAAVATLKLAVALDPYAVDSYVILGWTQHLAGNHSFAAQTLQQGLTQSPEHVPALNALGIVQLVSGELEAAVATHRRALELKPDNEIAHYNLSLAHERLRQFPEAVYHAQEATRLEPDNPHPWVALALAHWSQDATAEALTLYRQTMAIDSRYRSASHLDHLQQAGFSAEQIAATEALRQASLQN